jgi:hypothetical protein
MAGIAILRKLLLKEAAKGSGQASGILSIGDSVRKIADNKLQSYLLSAQKQGVDIDKMGENEIKYMLEMNKPKNKMKVVSQGDPEFKDIMDAMMGKKKDNVIEGKFGKSFKEEADEVLNTRQMLEDDKVAADMFQGGPTANDPKIDAEMLAEFIAEDAGKVYDDLPTKERLDFYDRAYEAIVRYKRDNSDFADGGRTGFFLGSKSPKGAALFRELLKFMDTRGGDKTQKSPLELLKRFNPKQYKKLLEDPLLYTKGREGIMASDAVKKSADEARKARIVMTDQLLDTAKKLRKSDKNIEEKNKKMIQAAIEAGVSPDLAEDYVRGITQSMLKATKMDAPKPSDEGILQLEQILKNLKTEGKTKRDLNADGGRIGFKKGMDRRTFMKIMGGLTTIPIFGKFFKGAEVATKAATKVPFESATRSEPPTYFIELINKIKLNGKKSKVGPSDRVDEYSYTGKNGDEYTLTEDITTGDAQIRKDKIGGRSYEEGSYDVIEDRTVMEYRAPRQDVDVETQKATNEAAEYEEYRVEFDQDGTEAGAEAIDEYIQKEIIEEAAEETPSIKKAGGGIARMLGE